MEHDGVQDVVQDVSRWGLSPDVVGTLAERLLQLWERFGHCFRTRTRDAGAHAQNYLRGLLTMHEGRNCANIARRVVDLEDDGQNLQHFLSDSPWDPRAVFGQIQAEIGARPDLAGGMLTVDESGDRRAGDQSAGAARQYIGRLGHTDMGQVGVVLGYIQEDTWAMVDAELYLPEHWFDEAHAELRRRGHVPPERTFATKLTLALEMVRRAKEQGLPFAVVGCDSLYGVDFAFRGALDAEGLLYMADITPQMRVYLDEPTLGVPERPAGQRGPRPTRPRMLSERPSVAVRDLVGHAEFPWHSVDVRQTERGLLSYACAARRVWVVKDEAVREEWLFIRREPDGTYSYSLSNAPTDTPLKRLAYWRSQRYFAERIFQDAKSEGGWDELVARKYRSWMHHTALDALALWFVAETKRDWAREHPRDPTLAGELGVERLPALSMANVRELLQATMPLHQLSPEEATRLVTKHLRNRSRSTASRRRSQRRARTPPEM
jgi:SRSO17 transposase